jgi:hypothetical protein
MGYGINGLQAVWGSLWAGLAGGLETLVARSKPIRGVAERGLEEARGLSGAFKANLGIRKRGVGLEPAVAVYELVGLDEAQRPGAFKANFKRRDPAGAFKANLARPMFAGRPLS